MRRTKKINLLESFGCLTGRRPACYSTCWLKYNMLICVYLAVFWANFISEHKYFPLDGRKDCCFPKFSTLNIIEKQFWPSSNTDSDKSLLNIVFGWCEPNSMPACQKWMVQRLKVELIR